MAKRAVIGVLQFVDQVIERAGHFKLGVKIVLPAEQGQGCAIEYQLDIREPQ